MNGLEGKAVEGGKHGEFELETIGGRDGEGRVMCGYVFREFDIEGLREGC